MNGFIYSFFLKLCYSVFASQYEETLNNVGH